MGNCIALHNNVIKIIKTDEEEVQFKPPMKVHEVLSNFGPHAVCDSLPVVQHLHPDTDMIGGRVYYLLPLVGVPPQKPNKTVGISSTVTTTGPESGVLRIKLVISKQELLAMLQKGGVKLDTIVSKHQINGKTNDTEIFSADDNRKSSAAWMPVLESIPEGN